MSKPTNADFVFVEVTKTFMMTQAQARKLVRVARLIYSDREMFSLDDDGSKIRTTGEDFLTDEGDHDYADAAAQLADPEGLLNINLVNCSTLQLDDHRIKEITRFGQTIGVKKLWESFAITAKMTLSNPTKVAIMEGHYRYRSTGGILANSKAVMD